MDSLTDNDLATSTATQLLNSNFIKTELFSQWIKATANSQAKQRRHSVLSVRSSPHTLEERFRGGDVNSNSSSSIVFQLPAQSSSSNGESQFLPSRLQQAEELYTAYANSNKMNHSHSSSHNNGNIVTAKAQQGPKTKLLTDSDFTDHPTRHFSEPGNVSGHPNSPTNNESLPPTQNEARPHSCRTSPSLTLPAKVQQQLQQQPQQLPPQQRHSSHSTLSSSISGLSGSSSLLVCTPQSAGPASPHNNWNAGSSGGGGADSGSGDIAGGMFLTPDPREFIRKPSGALPSLTAQDIRKVNGSGQLYLLVPSDCPVIMPGPPNGSGAGNGGVEDRNGLLAESLAAVAVSSSTLLSVGTTITLDKLRSASTGTNVREAPPSHQEDSTSTPIIRISVPHRNSTTIPPHLLKTINEVGSFDPQLATDIARTLNQSARSGVGDEKLPSLPHLSSLGSLGSYRLSVDLPPSPSSASPPPPLNNNNNNNNNSSGGGGGGACSRSSSPPPYKKKHALPADYNGANVMEVLAKQHSSVNAVPLLKTTSSELSGNSPSCESVTVDSTGNSLFFPSSESSPSRSYIGRISGDTKDIRRRVSHNEVERRRRDRINTWIAELYKLLPPDQQAKSQYQSKGVVLKRVCEYFRNQDVSMAAIREENRALKQEMYNLTQEVQILRAAVHFQSQTQQSEQYTASNNNQQTIEDSVPPSHHRSPKRPLLVSLQETNTAEDQTVSPSSDSHSPSKRTNRSFL